MSEANRTVRLPESWAADWVLDRALGSGSFSTVYRAVRRDRPSVEAAIKIISVPGGDAELAALRAEGMNAEQSQSYFDEIAREYGTRVLAKVPIDPDLAKSVDTGTVELFVGDWFENAANTIEDELKV